MSGTEPQGGVGLRLIRSLSLTKKNKDMETIKVSYNGFWGDTSEEVASVAKAKTRARRILREDDRIDDVYIIKGNSHIIAKIERVDTYNGKFQCVTIDY